MEDKTLFLSASRIDTFQNCSALYSAKYIYKIPDAGNDGSKRGSTVHDVLEILLNPRHKKIFDLTIKLGSCYAVTPLWKTILRFAKRYGVADKENLEIIDKFIMVALKNEFFGPKNTIEAMGEKEFNIKVDTSGKRYNIRGFIDQTFKINNEDGLILEIKDFKTSATKFAGEKISYNQQSLIYQLALRHLYPNIKKRNFHFLFLKFPRNPRQDQPSFSDEELNGFEWVLTELQDKMENFSVANSLDNVAAINEDNRWLCGREGYKKDGTRAWICSARNPLDYWVLLDTNRNIISSAFKKDELIATEGQKIEMKKYFGCPYWFNEKGEKRGSSQ